MTFDDKINELEREAELDFKRKIELMSFFLTIGDIVNIDKSFESKVDYKQKIVFATMDNLMQGDFKIPSDWKSLTYEQKNHRLDETIKSVIK